MAARKLCCKTKMPAKTLRYYMEEDMTGIAPTRLIFEQDSVAVGNVVSVNCQGKQVRAEILWRVIPAKINVLEFPIVE